MARWQHSVTASKCRHFLLNLSPLWLYLSPFRLSLFLLVAVLTGYKNFPLKVGTLHKSVILCQTHRYLAHRGRFHEALRLTKAGLSDWCIQQMHSLVRKSSFSKVQGLIDRDWWSVIWCCLSPTKHGAIVVKKIVDGKRTSKSIP